MEGSRKGVQVFAGITVSRKHVWAVGIGDVDADDGEKTALGYILPLHRP